VRCALLYHDGALDIDLGERRGVRVEGNDYPAPLSDPERSCIEALEKPVGAPALRTIIPRSGSVSVLISDLTRGGSTGRMLAGLLGFLEAHGAGPERVSVVAALGMHRGFRRGELEAHIGADTVRRWKVIEHDARDDASLLDVGTTPAGTPCLFNRAVAESSLVIVFGAVSFHYFAGYGGARKLILPGVAGERTIVANHRLSLGTDPGAGLARGCRSGALDGNPVHEDMLAGARLLGARTFAVNSVSGAPGRVAFVNAGELDASHRAACDFVSAHFRFSVERLYRAVIVSAGGFPGDINLLQSHKALRHASNALEEGELLLAAAACPEGIGSDSYLAAFESGRHAVSDAVRKRYTRNSQTAISTCELTSRFSIYLRSTLSDDLVARFGLCPWKPGYEEYLLEGIAGEDILVIADASRFLPVKR
jgi:nickel-dependent lactate racemase